MKVQKFYVSGLTILAISLALISSLALARPAHPHVATVPQKYAQAVDTSLLLDRGSGASRSELRKNLRPLVTPTPYRVASPATRRSSRPTTRPHLISTPRPTPRPTPTLVRRVVHKKPVYQPTHKPLRVVPRPQPVHVAVATGDPQAYAASVLSATQFECLRLLWNRESGWNYRAYNPSGAYGIPQALPGSKMASAGADWATNPITQVKWGLSYIADRYSTPCAAWAHSQATGWY